MVKINTDLMPMDYIKGQIIDSGSNSNGSYVKYSDGTMICYKTASGTVNITEVWGSGYTSGAEATINLGTWPVAFTALPVVSVTPIRDNSNYWLGAVRYTTKTVAGYCTLLRFNQSTGLGYTLNIVGYGKWK